jgi:hypothetical protein
LANPVEHAHVKSLLGVSKEEKKKFSRETETRPNRHTAIKLKSHTHNKVLAFGLRKEILLIQHERKLPFHTRIYQEDSQLTE